LFPFLIIIVLKWVVGISNEDFCHCGDDLLFDCRCTGTSLHYFTLQWTKII